jgi:site-specific DNA-methyltransferase (adenine-specific)
MAICLNGDCLELMKTLPDKSVDLFVCDLPYGCLTQQKGAIPLGRKKDGPCNSGCPWDIKIDLVAFWIQVKRLCKNDKTPVLMFCNTRFGIDLINSNPDWFRYDLVWNKNCGVNFLLANKQPMKSHEMIYVFSKKGCNYNRIDVKVEGKTGYKRPKNYIRPGISGCIRPIIETSGDIKDNTRCVLSVINFPTYHSKLHPTCKSVDLYKWLIERYSNEGDMVLDPTAGSFNSGRACLELNRQYIGIEMDKNFYDNNKILFEKK